MKHKSIFLKVGTLVFSLLTILMLKYILPNAYEEQANTIIPIFVITSVIYIIQQVKKSVQKRLFIISTVLGTVFSIFLVLGKQIYYNGFINYTDPFVYLSILLFGVLFGMILSLLTFRFSLFSLKLESIDQFLNKRTFWILMYLFVIIVWSIYWLAYYPGIVDGDNTYYFWMFTTKQFTAHHPLIHVLLIGNLFELGNRIVNSYNIGVAIYIWTQMIFCSLVLMYFIYRLYIQRVISSLIVIMSVIFYSGILLPIIPMNMITTTKDAIFSVVFFAFLILNYEFVDDFDLFIKKRINIFLYFFFGFLFLSFRNNAMYAFVVFSIIISIKSIISRKYRPIFLSVALIILYASVNYSLNTYYNVQSTKKYTEMMSVPLQGLARSYKRNNLSWTSYDISLLHKILDKNDLEDYNPYWSDIIKNKFNEEEFSSNIKLYLNLYTEKLKSNPTIFIDSILENTMFSWYPNSINEPRYTLYDRNLSEPDSSMLFITNVNKPASLNSKIPKLHTFLEEFSQSSLIIKIPFYSLLFSIGFMLWVFLYSLKLQIYYKNLSFIFVHIFMLIYLLTLMLGPVMFIRYFLFLWLLFPIFINSLFYSK